MNEGACGAQRDQGLIRNGYLRTGACCLHAGCSSVTWTVHKGVWVCWRLEFDSCIGQVYLMPGCTWGHCLGGTVPPRSRHWDSPLTVATPLLTSKSNRQPKCGQPKEELLRGGRVLLLVSGSTVLSNADNPTGLTTRGPFIGFWDYGPVQC